MYFLILSPDLFTVSYIGIGDPLESELLIPEQNLPFRI